MTGLLVGIRTIVRSPAWSVPSVAITAFGVALSTSMFSLVDARLLRPLPFREAEQLVFVVGATAPAATADELVAWFGQAESLSGLATYKSGHTFMLHGDSEERIAVAEVSGAFFEVLKGTPALGRLLSNVDEQVREQAVVISHGLWRDHFGTDHAVIGQRLLIAGTPRFIVGVASELIRFPERVDAWIPRIGLAYGEANLDTSELRAGGLTFGMIGRLRSGESIEKLRAELQTLQRRQEDAAYARNPKTGRGSRVNVRRLQDALVGNSAIGPFFLSGAVAFIVLIAWADLVNLQLSRTVFRCRKFAVQSALGASQWRQFREAAIEPFAVSVWGGCIGLLLTLWILRALDAAILLGPRTRPLSLGSSALGISAIVILGTAVFSTAATFLYVRRLPLHAMLASHSNTGTKSAMRFMAYLAVVPVSLSVVAAVGAGTMLLGLQRQLGVPTGLDTSNIVMADLSFRYAEDVLENKDSANAVMERLRKLESVTAITLVDTLPLTRASVGSQFIRIGEETGLAKTRMITNEFFKVLGIASVSGQTFEQTTASSAPAVIVNQKLARDTLGEQGILGRILQVSGENRTVVGVVASVRERWLDNQESWQIYVPLWQPLKGITPKRLVLALKTSNARVTLTTLKNGILAASPGSSVHRIQLLDDAVADTVASDRTRATLFGALLVVMLAMTASGTYGLSAHFVTLRTREIGIRMAMGAQARDIMTSIVKTLALKTVVGTVLGAVVSIAVLRVAGTLVHVEDASLTILAASVAVSVSAIGASYFPAWRATRRSPSMLLRYE